MEKKEKSPVTSPLPMPQAPANDDKMDPHRMMPDNKEPDETNDDEGADGLDDEEAEETGDELRDK